ncbi:MAG: DUF1456 family protein [Pseudomonadota bacterium]
MNLLYKKARYINKLLNGPDDKEVFRLGGLEVNSSSLQAWRAGVEKSNYRDITNEQLAAYMDGLIKILTKD